MSAHRAIRGLVGVVALTTGLLVLVPATASAAPAAAAASAAGPLLAQDPTPGDDTGQDPGGDQGGGNQGGGDQGENQGGDQGVNQGGGDQGGQNGQNGQEGQADAAARAQQQAQQQAAARQAELERRQEEQEAAEEARQREAEAAEQARKRAQQAAEAAADLAAAQRRTTQAWAARGRPQRMIVLRADGVEVVSGGRLIAQVPRTPGVLTLAGLNRLVPNNWVSLADDAARVTAAVVLTPGVTLDIGGVRTLRLSGGPTPADAASIYTGSGRVVARGVTVTSVDEATNLPMAAGPGRPFVVVAGGGRMDATDVTFSDLGTAPNDVASRGGVQYNEGSTGTLERTTFLRNTTGLQLSGTRNVRLDGVTVQESRSDGLLLEGDQGTVLRGVLAQQNGANGVLVKGVSSPRPITGITTTGNTEYGVAVVGQSTPVIAGVATAADKMGGLRINRSDRASVADFTATDQPIAIYTHVSSRDVTFERVRTTGGRRGVVVEKSTSGLTMRQSSVENASAVGVSLGGREINLDGLSVTGSKTAVRVERGAAGITGKELRLAGGTDGFVANPGTSRVALAGFVAEGIGNDAVRTFSPDTAISGGRIDGAETGIVTGAPATVADTTITKVDVGLSSRDGASTKAVRLAIAALSVGVIAAPTGPVSLTDSRVHALESLRGGVQLAGFNDLSLPPLNLLGAIGVPLIILAVLLELVHAARQRRNRRGSPAGRKPAVPSPAGAR